MRKTRLITVFLFVLLAFGFALAGFLRQQYVAPIIMYHSVSPEASIKTMLAVKPETFERQMAFLKKHKYAVLPLGELAGMIKEKKKLPPRAVAITFDDGYKNNFTYAFPVLKKYGLAATVFIITDEVGRSDRLSWEEIKEMQDSGLIYFGSHCLGPEPLVNIDSEKEIKRQIAASRQILEERLGKKVTLFSYPEGLFNDKIRKMVINAGYEGAVATNPGKDYPDDDVFALKRLRISERAASMFVFAVETSGYYTFMKESKRKKNAEK